MMKRAKRDEKMQQVIQKLIAKIDADPYDQESYYALGTALTEEKSFTQAEELFKKALNALSDRAEKTELLHYGLGNVYYASELYDEAIAQFNLVQDGKLQAQAYTMLAQSYYAKANYQKALVFALTASEKLRSVATLSLMGDCFLALGNFGPAKDYYQQALQLEPNDARINFQLGVIAVVNGADPTAYFDRAEQSDPKLYQTLKTRLNDVEQTMQATTKKK